MNKRKAKKVLRNHFQYWREYRCTTIWRAGKAFKTEEFHRLADKYIRERRG